MRKAQILLLIRRRIGERRGAVIARRREARRHVLAEQRDSPVSHATRRPRRPIGIVSGKPIGRLAGKPISNRGNLAEADAGERSVMNTSPA